MNIAKIKDIRLDTSSGLSAEDVQLFNTYFSGQYVYDINWIRCVPLNEITPAQYISISQNSPIAIPVGVHSISHNDISIYMDISETDRVNDISKYVTFNQFTPSELTVAEVKIFRTWLAATILSFNQVTDNNINHMLTYYSQHMYDDVVSALSVFGSAQTTITTVNKSTCGCGKTISPMITDVPRINACDPQTVYHNNLYALMVKTFSDIDFWTQFDNDFLIMFKSYIDNIITMNLSLVGNNQSVIDYVDCSIGLEASTVQENNILRLQRLTNSIQLLITGDITGHKTYIATSLSDWATYLYEIMEW